MNNQRLQKSLRDKENQVNKKMKKRNKDNNNMKRANIMKVLTLTMNRKKYKTTNYMNNKKKKIKKKI